METNPKHQRHCLNRLCRQNQSRTYLKRRHTLKFTHHLYTKGNASNAKETTEKLRNVKKQKTEGDKLMKLKESPMLFSTPMVIAADNETKTETRRTRGLETFNVDPAEWQFKQMSMLPDGKLHACFIPTNPESVQGIFSAPFPYGKVGDLIWVRETHAFHFMWEGIPVKKWKQSFSIDGTCIFYKATDKAFGSCMPEQKEKGWRPSVFMPKEAARLWLEITSIKAERLQDITEQSAANEGIYKFPGGEYQFYMRKKPKNFDARLHTAKESFMSLWIAINGPASWEQNPWVWVIGFKKTTKPCQ